MIRKSILCSLSTLAAIASQGVAAQADDALFNASKPLEIVDQGTFSIPGRYVKAGEHTIMVGAMYVQYQIPKNKTRPYPIVFIHGGGQTAANYLSTPDGRRGWPTISSPTAMPSIWSISPDAAARDSSAPPTESRGRNRSRKMCHVLPTPSTAGRRMGCTRNGQAPENPAIRPSTTSWRPAWKASATSS
jgi:hypothetical protein